MLIKYVERLNGIAQHFVNMLMKKEFLKWASRSRCQAQAQPHVRAGRSPAVNFQLFGPCNFSLTRTFVSVFLFATVRVELCNDRQDIG